MEDASNSNIAPAEQTPMLETAADELGGDYVPPKPPAKRKVQRTQAQVDALEKARKIREANVERAKQEKEARKIQAKAQRSEETHRKKRLQLYHQLVDELGFNDSVPAEHDDSGSDEGEEVVDAGSMVVDYDELCNHMVTRLSDVFISKPKVTNPPTLKAPPPSPAPAAHLRPPPPRINFY